MAMQPPKGKIGKAVPKVLGRLVKMLFQFFPVMVPLTIVCILFSDTMIAESQFAGQKWAYPLILPTYYLCHLLVAASQLWR